MFSATAINRMTVNKRISVFDVILLVRMDALDRIQSIAIGINLLEY